MEKRKNIPVLRFPEFDGEWNEKSFGSLFSFKITNSFSRDQLNYEEGNVKNIHYGDIHTKFNTLFDITNEEVPFLNNSVSLERISDENYCKEGDVIFADASEDLNDVGKRIEVLKLDNQKVLSGLHTILARPNEKVFHDGFAGYLMKSNFVRTQIQREAQGTKVLSISSKRLSGIYIPYPAKPEQHKIASFFTAIDQKISHLKKKHQLLEQYKKGVMQQIFSQQIRFKDENGREFPKWEKKKLSFAMTIPPQNKPSIIDRNKLITVKLHLKGITKNENTDTLIVGSTNYYIRRKGQFIYGKQNLFNGAFGIIPVEYDGYLSSGDVHALDINHCKLNPTFLFLYFSRLSFYRRLEDIASGSGSKRIHEKGILGIEMLFPSLPEQTRIANFLSAIDDKIHHTQKQIEQAEQWKKGLMQKMFV